PARAVGPRRPALSPSPVACADLAEVRRPEPESSAGDPAYRRYLLSQALDGCDTQRTSLAGGGTQCPHLSGSAARCLSLPASTNRVVIGRRSLSGQRRARQPVTYVGSFSSSWSCTSAGSTGCDRSRLGGSFTFGDFWTSFSNRTPEGSSGRIGMP